MDRTKFRSDTRKKNTDDLFALKESRAVSKIFDIKIFSYCSFIELIRSKHLQIVTLEFQLIINGR